MELEETKAVLAETIRNWHQKGWSPATSTNYSFRLSDDPDTIYISRSGIDKSQFTADDFMEVDLLGMAKPRFADARPSAETLIHCTLYKLFPETQCIVHSHSVYSVLHSAIEQHAVKIEGYEILKGFEGITTHETAVDCPIFDNTQDMTVFSETLRTNKDRLTIPAFIMRKHGTYAWGKNLFDAKRHLESIEYLLECEWKLGR
ncbi:MAG: methylthioribulose-1-phosphate dehydratase [Candidatus Fluviicola riflensis]|nr:MAG: methylthioribulose 1-phosphate dehydratase [Candidatus Fluviicola riflensis]OGS76641.1 MAG: methylthioribulose-1-phosphate dehydratase [Candidatus Fluviicola riflensis]OGS83004.1 MAG: methylthioribulose-1-phosphate dehydratase [Fluviicola sp. RIFCSPHIGHO2_01_FULL_43_53]OGS88372.1 MAG: methylthioribulose-1-phosphate dehydratase [Fluviicola sp. RIFCSPHIGHO2_12_FULL_43_24]